MTPAIESLSGRLPAMTPAAARLSRLAFDTGFQRWAQATLGLPDLSVSTRDAHAHWVLQLETDHGAAELAVDAAGWMPLELALGIDEPATAAAVATALLQPWADLLSPVLGEPAIVRSRRVEPARGAQDAATLGANGWLVGWRGADARLLDRLEALARAPTDLSILAALPLRPRLRLMTRRWPSQVLRTLARGDIVLVGDSPASLRAGVGCVLSMAVSIHPKEFTVQVADHPQMTDDAASAETDMAAAPALDELQLPIVFELDTARISLGALANMRPGYAVELDVPLREAPVRLVCHGQTLGEGQLVAIGDQLGVRITRLEHPPGATA